MTAAPTTCYRCTTPAEPSDLKCRECGCVAFIRGQRPAFPPVYQRPSLDPQGRPETLGMFGAFLLGPLPRLR